MNMIEKASSQLKKLLTDAFMKVSVEDGIAVPSFNIEIPADTTHGDFASNIAMTSAKAFKQPPRAVAEKLIACVDLTDSFFSHGEVAGPGFINFFLDKVWFSDIVENILEEGSDFGRTKTESDTAPSALVEFVSANPTGPMHVGNARGGAIGDTLASILDWAGWHVEREFYVNDAGNQINKFALSLEVRYLQIFDPTVQMPEDAYQGQDIKDHAQSFAAEFGDKYLKVSEDERRNALVDFALPKNIAGLKRDLASYRIIYDNWYLESTIHNSGSIDKILALFESKGATYKKDDALWFKATEYGADQDFVLVRSNGVPTYVVPDIVYHYDKLVTRGFDKAIDLLGADHHGYVPRLKAALTALGVDCSRLDAIVFQMVRLVREGEVIKASKRSGKAITLVTLLEDVPVDAARFFFNLREPNSHFDFDLDLAIDQSSQNPVYYVQYAHARICSILKNIEEQPVGDKVFEATEEYELIRFLGGFPGIISESAKKYDPSLVTKYAQDLAAKFHKFYAACRVKDAPKEYLAGRVALCESVKIVLKNISEILKIDAPESM